MKNIFHTSMEWVIAIRTPTWKTNRFENSRLLQVQIPELIITQRRLFVVSPQTVCGYQFNKPNFVVVVARIDASRTFMQAGKRTAPNANWPRTHFLELVHSFHYVSHIRWYLISWVELVTLLFTSFLFRCPSHHTQHTNARAWANSGWPVRCMQVGIWFLAICFLGCVDVRFSFGPN